MSAANFEACVALILASEGGFVDDPADPGGATNHGITIETLEGVRGRPQTEEDVRALTEADAAAIYRADYFTPAGCDIWPAGVDLMVFDCAVNQGLGHAIRTLQVSVGAAADGEIGPATKAAVASHAPALIIARMSVLRGNHYRSLPTFPRFGKGWLTRLARTTDAADRMATP